MTDDPTSAPNLPTAGIWMLPWLDEFDLDEIAASEEFMR